MFEPFRPIVRLLTANEFVASLNETISPTDGVAGNVRVQTPPDVSANMPVPATAPQAADFESHVVPPPPGPVGPVPPPPGPVGPV